MLGKKRSASIFAPAAEPETPMVQSVEERRPAAQPPVMETVTEAKPKVLPEYDDEPRRTLASESGASARTHNLFFTPEVGGRDFASVLRDVQEYISSEYSGLIIEGGDEARDQLKRYIAKFVQDKRIAVAGMDADELIAALYSEMAEYGFLTKYIYGEGIEEINSATRS